jgi:hypothetical protein
METVIFDTREVQITSVYFRNNPAQRRLESYPRRMVMDGREYTFLESGMRYLVHKGQQLVSLFDVSDGHTQYRLRVDGENHWTLIGTKATA